MNYYDNEYKLYIICKIIYTIIIQLICFIEFWNYTFSTTESVCSKQIVFCYVLLCQVLLYFIDVFDMYGIHLLFYALFYVFCHDMILSKLCICFYVWFCLVLIWMFVLFFAFSCVLIVWVFHSSFQKKVLTMLKLLQVWLRVKCTRNVTS